MLPCAEITAVVKIHRVYRFGLETCDLKWKICCPKDSSQLTFTMACVVISDSPKIEMCIDLFEIGSRAHLALTRTV